MLRTLRLRAILPREIADLLFNLKRLGNEAVHEDVGTPANALFALKIARSAAVWFHQSYGGKPNFKAGPFVPPRPPVDATAALAGELEELRKQVRASSDDAAKALLAVRDAEEARLRALSEVEAHKQDREFWEGEDAFNAVLDPGLVRHEGIAERGLAHETNNVSGDVRIAHAAIGLAQGRLGEAVGVEQHREFLQLLARQLAWLHLVNLIKDRIGTTSNVR